MFLRRGPRHLLISIHAPREGGDIGSIESGQAALPFQSTPPARGATLLGRLSLGTSGDFNPRPPRGGRLLLGSLLSDD